MNNLTQIKKRRYIVSRMVTGLLCLLLFCSCINVDRPNFILTHEEISWLKRHKNDIRVAVSPDWAPYEIINEKGNYVGFSADYLALIEKMLDIRFEIIVHDKWYEILEKTEKREIDVLLSVVSTPERRKYLLFTPPYYTAPYHIITKQSNNNILGIEDLIGKKVVYTKGYAIEYFIQRGNPEIYLTTVNTEKKAIEAVIFGEADALIACLTTTFYAVEKAGLPGLKNAGYSGFTPAHCIASRSDWPILSTILSKALESIDTRKRANIHRKWLSLYKTDYVSKNTWYLLLSILIVVSIGSLFVVVWNYSLRRRVEKKTSSLKENEKRLSESLVTSEKNLTNLKISEKNFKELIEHHTNGILILHKREPLLCNTELQNIFGKPIRFDINEFENVLPEHHKNLSSFCSKVHHTSDLPTSVSAQLWTLPQDNDQVSIKKWVHCHASNIRYMDKSCVLVVVVDITASKDMENILMVQDKMASLGRISAGIAHDIRSPLSGINVFLDQLSRYLPEPDCPPTAVQIIEEIKLASNKIESVIRRVMDFAKSSNPICKPSQMNDILKKATNLISPSLRKEGIKLEMYLTDSLDPFMAEQSHIQNLLFNLIDNCKEAMEGQIIRKKITIKTSQKASTLYLIISDNGPGFSEHNKDHIFEPFYTTKSYGTGIGLSICQRIVTDHGGTIYADMGMNSGSGSGAVITVKFPALKSK